jgi:hypothetical protein
MRKEARGEEGSGQEEKANDGIWEMTRGKNGIRIRK